MTITASGDFSLPKLRAATHKSSRIVGDVVKHYLKFAAGKMGVTFAVDIEAARELCAAYRLAGVPAEIITGDTPIGVRGQLMRKFKARQILQLVSVDCLGEGVDVPAIEVISMVRKTASWQLMCQQFGRALRVMVDPQYWRVWDQYTDAQRLAIIAASTKPKALIIDHVGNIIWHAKTRGMPDVPQDYSLLRTDGGGRSKSDAIPLRACTSCYKPYERFYVKCPYCGVEPPVFGRGSPESVDGDLILLEPAVLAALRGEVDRVNGPVDIPTWADAGMRKGMLTNHHNRYRSQQSLQRFMMLWGGWQRGQGRDVREAQRLFYLRFGMDYMTAQTLNAADATALEVRIATELQRNNVTEATVYAQAS